jgi:hypothetical protein
VKLADLAGDTQAVATQKSAADLAVGDWTVGRLAVGRLAVGRLAVGRLAVGRLAVGDLAVGDLGVGDLGVGDLGVELQPSAGLSEQSPVAGSFGVLVVEWGPLTSGPLHWGKLATSRFVFAWGAAMVST